jgi:hypothetical protein
MRLGETFHRGCTHTPDMTPKNRGNPPETGKNLLAKQEPDFPLAVPFMLRQICPSRNTLVQ